jgi:hypothetical protein
MTEGVTIDAKIMFIIFIMPITTLIIWYLYISIGGIIDTFFYPIPANYHKEEKIPSDDITVYRCTTLMNVAKALRNSDTMFKYDTNVKQYFIKIKNYRYRDMNKANLYCSQFENYLIMNKTAVAQVEEGYIYLRSIGEI